jgi:hypothetical protein
MARAAYTYNLTSCTQLAFEDCYYRGMVGGVFVKYVEVGDTISLPAGSGTWGNPLNADGSPHGNNGIVYITTAITVKGQGDSTVITMHENGPVYATGAIVLLSQVVWKDMKIKGASDRPVTCFAIGANGVRITNVTYEGQPDSVPNNGQNGSGYFVFQQGVTGTLIDHCRISSPLGDQEWIFTRGPADAWQSASTIGTSQADVFVEDCTFTNRGYSDANANARHVFRFNTFSGDIKLDAHGAASNSPFRSFRSVEYYNNTWTGTSTAMEIRGGTAMVFNNSTGGGNIFLRDYSYDASKPWPNYGISGTVDLANPTVIHTDSSNDYQTGWRVWVQAGFGNATGTIYNHYVATVVNSTQFTIPVDLTPETNDIAAYAIDVTRWANSKTISSNQTFTFTAAPTVAAFWMLKVTNSGGTTVTATIPTSYNGNPVGSTISSITIPAGAMRYLVWYFDPYNWGGRITVYGNAAECVSLPPLDYTARYLTPQDYPIKDQVGNGRDGYSREPAYIWGNGQARTIASPNTNAHLFYASRTGTPNDTFSERDIIQANRDFFASSGFDTSTGVTVGTRAAMDAYTPSVTGYGWWVTDEGSWNTKLPANTSGRLYKWTGSAWTLFYTPYTYPHPLQTATECAQPDPSVPSGTYEYSQSVTLQATPSDATIRYTTNGTTPSESVGTVYSGAITISSTTNLKAIAYKSGLGNSQVLDATYTITGAVFQPTSSVQTGSYHGTQTVALSCATSGAEIRYTLDGSTPNGSSTLYSSALTVPATTTIKAIGIKSGLSNSSVLSIGITILLEIGNWNIVTTSQQLIDSGYRTGFAYFTASVTGNLTKISLYGTNTSATQDIEFGLYHDIDGDNSAGNLEKITGTPAQFNNVGTWATEWKDFTVNLPVTAGEKYWIFMGVSEPSVTGITAGGVGAGYPWDRWNGNTGNIGDAWPSTIGFTSNRDAWVYNIKGTLTETGGTVLDVAQPVASVATGVYTTAQSVTLTCATSGATIYYTLDGSTPTTASSVYSGSITIGLGGVGTAVRTLKAYAVRTGLNNSSVMTENYSMFTPSQSGFVVTTLNAGTLIIQ